MKLLHTSDWHLGKTLYDFSLLDDQSHFIDWLLELVERESVDAVLIAGDIFDRPVPAGEAMALFDRFLCRAALELHIQVLCIAGNHDNATRLEFASALTGPSGYSIAGHARREIRRVALADRHGPVHIHLLPYLYPADVRALFDGERVHTFDDAHRVLLAANPPVADARHVLVAHGFFGSLGGADKELITSDSEVSVGGTDLTDSAYLLPYSYAALGHLHAPQRAGAEHVRYAGSPLKYSLSEERQKKSVTLVELGAPGEVHISAVPVPAMRDVRTVTGRFEELMDPAWHGAASFDDYVFADITDLGATYPMEKLRTLFPRLLGLRFLAQQGDDGPVVQVGAARERLSAEQLFRRFYESTRGEEMSDEQLAVLRDAIARAEREEVLP